MDTFDTWEDVPRGVIVLDKSPFPMYFLKLDNGEFAYNSAENDITNGWCSFKVGFLPGLGPFERVAL
ncbi:hypothetical protein AN911_00900 [Mycobacteroides immunogenum]|uniref:Uncharacterized protein n=1 Tax=Mycobacteroides immunogenum TaxID=83262 RepID=A0A7V8LR65_9MYCO|nr:hypothetical protein AN909_05500 [Mycobacteroides immunogenum]KPG14293.1 hypothetical protein AN908_06905 [Mycobacteroides immunogenum]KPG14363.1 hypothetical protein AN908_07375 [Mycobacteroides immunogenum]KPG17432.1 hypothetical protein AN910_04725 [Mycobacteroides immunogenum]KPG23984.1 hypothetical protein AN911_00435 [Mycobacteroides immunogenum]